MADTSTESSATQGGVNPFDEILEITNDLDGFGGALDAHESIAIVAARGARTWDKLLAEARSHDNGRGGCACPLCAILRSATGGPMTAGVKDPGGDVGGWEGEDRLPPEETYTDADGNFVPPGLRCACPPNEHTCEDDPSNPMDAPDGHRTASAPHERKVPHEREALYAAGIDAGADVLGYSPLPETYVKVVRAAVDTALAARPAPATEQEVRDEAEPACCPVCGRDPRTGGEHWYDHIPAAKRRGAEASPAPTVNAADVRAFEDQVEAARRGEGKAYNDDEACLDGATLDWWLAEYRRHFAAALGLTVADRGRAGA